MLFYPIAFAAAYFGVSIVHASAILERAALNGPCTGKNNAPGVCIPTAKCSSGGGEFISNRCPGTPNNVKCCTKASCGGGGNCRFTSDCTGNTLANQCPGPANFKCCVPKAGGGGGGGGSGNYPTPSFPAVGACKAKAVDGARKIVAGNPGAVRQIYCTRACACGSGSDHCCGLATDMMCSSAGGVSSSLNAKSVQRKDPSVSDCVLGSDRVGSSDCRVGDEQSGYAQSQIRYLGSENLGGWQPSYRVGELETHGRQRLDHGEPLVC